MRIYLIMYAICFVITFAALMLAVIVGDRVEYGEAKHQKYDYEKITKRQWISFIIKAALISAGISILAPLALAGYVIILIAAGLALLDDRHL